ncbi:restriction endonuclease subunit S [Halomonas sp. MC140]|nr:restriction endonuclease subunit S [Halomonas sp. MC140]MDN7131070.1 restriction endonuclease subunit S [Halomonas sp. MC140]
MNIAAYPKHASFKQSGFEWVGDVPSHWEVEKLGSMLTVVSEKNHPDLPLLSITREKGVIKRDIEDQDSNHNFIPDDLSGYKVLRKGQFGMNKMKAWQGSYGVSAHTGIVSPAYFIFDFVREVDQHFFSIAIRSKLYVSYFGSASDGVRVGQWDLNQARMRQIPILLPPLPEQYAIAAFLDKKCATIDEVVGIKEEQIKLLRERRQILIQQAVTRGLNPDAPMKDSGIDWIGEIPAHWQVRSIRYAFRFRNYQRIPLSGSEREHMQGEFPYYGASGIIDYVEDYIFDEDLILIAEDGANLLSKSTPLAFVARGKYWVNNHAHILEPLFPGFEYWAELLSAVDYTIYISGSAQPKLTRDRLGNVQVPVPSSDERNKIIELINKQSEKFRKAISIKKDQIATLKEYKTSLINSAVTGKIKVI